MGLGLEVGILAGLLEMDKEGYAHYKEQFQVVRQVLSNSAQANHVEPEEVEGIFTCDMAGYSPLHCLRCVGAHLALGRSFPPPGNLDAYKDPVLTEYHQRFRNGDKLRFQHLILHSDAEGFYVPVDFELVIDAQSMHLAGGWLGSTQRLQAECQQIEALLNASYPPVRKSWWSREPAQYGPERFAIHQLLQACEASLRMKAAIVFG
jgi:hypothetical protein